MKLASIYSFELMQSDCLSYENRSIEYVVTCILGMWGLQGYRPSAYTPAQASSLAHFTSVAGYGSLS